MNEETKPPTTTDVVTERDKGRCAPALGYAAFYDNHSRRIYLRTPQRDELGEPGHCDHGLDHATALRLRDELNDALLGRPHNNGAQRHAVADVEHDR